MTRRRCAITALALVIPTFVPTIRADAQQTRGAYTDERKLPDSPAGRRARELIELVNSGDSERVKKYLEGNVAQGILHAHPIEQHLAIFAQLHEQSGEFEFYSVRKYEKPVSEDELVVI